VESIEHTLEMMSEWTDIIFFCLGSTSSGNENFSFKNVYL